LGNRNAEQLALVHDAAIGDHSGLALLCVEHMEAAE
jgi:hypothetical protein